MMLTVLPDTFYIIMWIVIAIAAIVVEVSTVQLVSVWFAVAGFASAICAAFKVPIVWQIAVFVLIAVLAFFVLRPLLKKLSKKHEETISATIEGLIGEQVVVLKAIKVGEVGEIKAKYDSYAAIAPEEVEDIKEGTKVIIDSIQGNKVIVKTLKEEKGE